MTDAAERAIHLSDYAPPPYLVDNCDLTFRLDPDATHVLSRITFRPNPASSDRTFSLDGERMRLVEARIDGKKVSPQVGAKGLTCAVPDAPFVWEAEVVISPQGNTALEGLYMSNGMYCTQCEAEGFRRITYYPDRPDVMATFTVRIEGEAPVLLSNGNPAGRGEGWAEWHDPWPKPSYLFALVAGDLRAVTSPFATRSGHNVELNVWVRPGDEKKCDYALDALRRSMKWDEEVYGREYDLNIFNIVAVDDFNSGAMENKGLNIFNSALVLCSPETATDADYERIEGVIAHEYFHNWTGNRITCRDWFQLSLKEGLTVFRDQQFTSDMRSAAVKRIADVRDLRAYQFKEDAGPLAHPVRPESFVEINNFYTATVYEKGAELIGMLRRIVGDDAYGRALETYFERFDGTAATIEDWLSAFEATSDVDLGQFRRWYAQAGTPRVSVSEHYSDGAFRLDLKQETPPTPGQQDKAPMHIPVAIGLLNANGDEMLPTEVIHLTEAEQSFEFKGLPSRPVASVLRGFSASVRLDYPRSPESRAFLLAHDTDPFNAWDAAQTLVLEALIRRSTGDDRPETSLLDALRQSLGDETRDPAFRALLLDFPSEAIVAQAIHDGGQIPDPDAIHAAKVGLLTDFARHAEGALSRLYETLATDRPFSPTPAEAARRSLKNTALAYLSRIDAGERAAHQFDHADNMTDSLAALAALIRADQAKDALKRFETRWHNDRLVMNKWFSLQAALAAPDGAVKEARRLTEHRGFDPSNPNRFRAVLGAFAMNQAGFHHESGEGYRFVVDWLIRMDARNPQVAARTASVFQTLPIWDNSRKNIIKQELDRLLATRSLSRDTREMVSRLREG